MPAKRRPSRTPTSRRRRVRYLTELELAYVVFELAAQFFPAESYGTPMPEFQLDDDDQSVSRLQSAIYLPMQPYYRTVYDKAACLFRSLVKNHPLKDGNKRLGVVALDVFLRTNGIDFKATQDEVVNAALVIAKHPGNFPLGGDHAVDPWQLRWAPTRVCSSPCRSVGGEKPGDDGSSATGRHEDWPIRAYPGPSNSPAKANARCVRTRQRPSRWKDRAAWRTA